MSPEPAQPNRPAREVAGEVPVEEYRLAGEIRVQEYQLALVREFFGDHFDDERCVRLLLAYGAHHMAREFVSRLVEAEKPEAVGE